MSAAFEYWHVFHRLEPVLSSEDNHAILLDDVQETTPEGVSGAKKQKEIKQLQRVKASVSAEINRVQVRFVKY